jgi:hypothetical protein
LEGPPRTQVFGIFLRHVTIVPAVVVIVVAAATTAIPTPAAAALAPTVDLVQDLTVDVPMAWVVSPLVVPARRGSPVPHRLPPPVRSTPHVRPRCLGRPL